MSSASQWIYALAEAVEARSGPRVVQLLDPKVQIKGKDKVDYEQMPAETMQARRILNQSGIAED